MSIKKRKYFYIFANIYMILASAPKALEMYFDDKNVLKIIVFVAICLLIINILTFVAFYLIEKAFKKFEKRSLDKYNLYDWLGNPQSPINLTDKLINKKDFDPKSFQENCVWVKGEIKKQITDLEGLKRFKLYLDLKDKSPRLKTITNVFQSLIVAMITSSFVTFFNFKDFDVFNMKTSAIFFAFTIFFIFLIGLVVFIDFTSKEIDRERFLLVLVDECIIEEEDNQNSKRSIENNGPTEDSFDVD